MAKEIILHYEIRQRADDGRRATFFTDVWAYSPEGKLEIQKIRTPYDNFQYAIPVDTTFEQLFDLVFRNQMLQSIRSTGITVKTR